MNLREKKDRYSLYVCVLISLIIIMFGVYFSDIVFYGGVKNSNISASDYFVKNILLVDGEVPTSSMKNTIDVDDRIIASRLSYVFEDPERLDVVVFESPDNEKEYYVKRIIGLPKDKIEILDGVVYVNDSLEPLDESLYVFSQDLNNFGPFNVPENKYFMLGDNRLNSYDSRYWDNTYIDETKIIGKVVIKYFPKLQFFINKI